MDDRVRGTKVRAVNPTSGEEVEAILLVCPECEGSTFMIGEMQGEVIVQCAGCQRQIALNIYRTH